MSKLSAKQLIEQQLAAIPGTHQDFDMPGAAALAKELGVEEIRVKHVMAAGRPCTASDVAKLVAEYFGVSLPQSTPGMDDIATYFAVETEPVNPYLRNVTTAAKNEGQDNPGKRDGTGPAKGSAQRKVSKKGKRGEICKEESPARQLIKSLLSSTSK